MSLVIHTINVLFNFTGADRTAGSDLHPRLHHILFDNQNLHLHILSLDVNVLHNSFIR